MHERQSTSSPVGVDLHQLPVFAPDPALWGRLHTARAAHMRSRRHWRAGLAATATMAAALCAAILLAPQVEPQPAIHQAIAADQRESQSLQAEWLRVADGAGAARPVTRLRAIDASLQAAYDRGAAAEELVPLWQQRNRALRGLIERAHDGDNASGTVRI